LTFLYRAAWAAARAAAPILGTGDGKLARSLTGRLRAADALAQWAAPSRDTSRPLIWFHAASVGEGRQAEAVITRLRRQRPEWQLVYTFSSASAEAFAQQLDVAVAGYLPADTPRDTARTLDALAPSAIIFSATDLWPELVGQAHQRGVRVALISAALPPTSSRRGIGARALLSDTYRSLDIVGAVDAPDADGLVQLGVPRERITITGDTRHDAAATRAAAIDRHAPYLRAIARSDRPVIVAGSTWPADEAVLLPALAALHHRTPFALVIAPHETDAAHLVKLERSLKDSLGDVKVARLAQLDAGPWDVCLVDRVGILAELYAAARVAYVGGGFHKAGLHSVIEPAALGIPVVFGPRWQTSRDARLLLDQGGVTSAANEMELTSAIERYLMDAEAHDRAGAAARSVVTAGLGAAQRSLELVLRLVEQLG
jgi:3-deoxy-D-manno-octulosonic-acid transferase